MTLSPRQTEILELAASGMIDKEIARALGIAHRTVRQHFEYARDKTGHRRTGAAVAWLLGEATVEQILRVRERLGVELEESA